jgi:hypothetical protein
MTDSIATMTKILIKISQIGKYQKFAGGLLRHLRQCGINQCW